MGEKSRNLRHRYRGHARHLCTQAKAVVDAEGKSYELSEGYRETLSTGSLAGFLEVRKAASIAFFLMSKGAAVVINQLVRKLDGLSMETEPVIELHKAEIPMVYGATIPAI